MTHKHESVLAHKKLLTMPINHTYCTLADLHTETKGPTHNTVRSHLYESLTVKSLTLDHESLTIESLTIELLTIESLTIESLTVAFKLFMVEIESLTVAIESLTVLCASVMYVSLSWPLYVLVHVS